MGYLFDLAEKHHTDKKERDHNYVLMYEKLMERNRLSTKKVLEIGFGEGGSIKMWQNYFTNADIYCIEYFGDEHEKVWKSPSTEIPYLKVIRGNSTEKSTWNEAPYDIDYIIDDGSHQPEHQIETFLLGFPHLKSHGLYFIEDTHCNFEIKYTGGVDVIYKWVFNYIIEQQTPGRNYGGNFYQSRASMPDVIKDIYSYGFYKSVIVFEKA